MKKQVKETADKVVDKTKDVTGSIPAWAKKNKTKIKHFTIGAVIGLIIAKILD